MTEPAEADVKYVSPAVGEHTFDEVAEAVEPGDTMRAPDGHLMVKPTREVEVATEDSPPDAVVADVRVPQNPDESQDIRFIPDPEDESTPLGVGQQSVGEDGEIEEEEDDDTDETDDTDIHDDDDTETVEPWDKV